MRPQPKSELQGGSEFCQVFFSFRALTNSIIQKHTRTLAAVAPAEAGSIGSTVPVVWKEETVVFVRDRVRVERTALGIVGGQSKVVEAVPASRQTRSGRG